MSRLHLVKGTPMPGNVTSAKYGQIKPDLVGSVHREIGERLRALRIAAGLTQRQLADAMREYGHPWTLRTVTEAQTGRNRYLDDVEIRSLAAILNCTAEDIIGTEEGSAPVREAVADYAYAFPTAPLPQLTNMLRYAAASLMYTPDELLEEVEEDLREAALVLIPAAAHAEGKELPQLDGDKVDAREAQSTTSEDHLQAFFGAPGQRAALDELAKAAGCTRVEILRRMIAAALPVFREQLLGTPIG